MPPTKSEPFSDLITLTLPLHPTNSRKLTMNVSVLRKYTNTMCMALIDRQVHRATNPLTSFRRSFTMNVSNKSTSQYINGGSSLILPFDKSVIYCCRSFPLRQIQQTVVNFFSTIFTINSPNKSVSQYINGGSSLILPFTKSSIFCCRSFLLNCLHLAHFEMIIFFGKSFLSNTINLRLYEHNPSPKAIFNFGQLKIFPSKHSIMFSYTNAAPDLTYLSNCRPSVSTSISTRLVPDQFSSFRHRNGGPLN